MYQDSVLSK